MGVWVEGDVSPKCGRENALYGRAAWSKGSLTAMASLFCAMGLYHCASGRYSCMSGVRAPGLRSGKSAAYGYSFLGCMRAAG